jgi:hypothetical protein
MEQPDVANVVCDQLEKELGLYDLISDKFWGTVEIQFQNGYPVTIKKTETKKIKGNNPNDKRTI